MNHWSRNVKCNMQIVKVATNCVLNIGHMSRIINMVAMRSSEVISEENTCNENS